MKLEEHILNDIKPLNTQAKAGETLSLMDELKLSHLPVVHEGKYVGLISENDLLDIENEEDRLEQHLKVLRPYSLKANDHLFKAMGRVGEGNLSLLPILSAQKDYLGYLSPLEIIQDLGRKLTFSEAGSLIVLEVGVRDYHLSQLTQIIESDDATITGLLVSSAGVEHLRIALKINRTEVSRIVKSLERYDYKIIEVYHKSIFGDDASDRLEGLLKYMNI
jgi:CBS domain-containing protein